ncbi:hypothetical protein FQA39_LY18187 [Lamprigera yunnana]|nr:hypothetical protein FQA39_LY18187 [Lamprigera yunnana]
MDDNKSNDDADLPEHQSEQNVVSHSILTVLQDKNRFISLLQQQIQHQKGQLQFYLHKGLSAPRVLEMAKHCAPVEAEENLQVNLALTQFCKQTGLKSRIMSLHERMVNVEKRLLRVASEEEEMAQCVLKRISGDSNQAEILSKILESCDILRTELEAFRTCCSRLILIEDERNCLVEQVYSVPITERMNYSVFLTALHEKMRLEREVVDIKEEQKALVLRLNSIRPQNKLGDAPMPFSLKIYKDNKKDGDVDRLREINGLLAAKVSTLQQDVECKEVIENKMEQVIDEYQTFRENSSKQLTELHKKLGTVLRENDNLNKMLQHYQEIDSEIKSLRAQVANMNSVQKERDHLKKEVGDLQQIRLAYAKLIEKPMSSDGALKQVNVLGKELHDKTVEVMQLRNEIDGKNCEIKQLSLLVGTHQSSRSRKVTKCCSVMLNTPIKSYKSVGCNASWHNYTRTQLQGEEKTFPMTRLKVQSINPYGISETLRAVVDSTSPVDGIIQLSNNSTFSVRLTCGAQMDCVGNQHITTKTENAPVNSIKMDEYELMKDSSKEAITMHIPPLHQNKIINASKIFEDVTIHSVYERRSIGDSNELSGLENTTEEEDDSGTSRDKIKQRIKRLVERQKNLGSSSDMSLHQNHF